MNDSKVVIVPNWAMHIITMGLIVLIGLFGAIQFNRIDDRLDKLSEDMAEIKGALKAQGLLSTSGTKE